MSGERNLGIFLYDDVEVLDFAGPFEVFNVTSELVDPSPFNVFTIAEEEFPIQARGKLTVTPDWSIDTTPPPDILIIPGGWGSRAVLEKTNVLDWVKDMAEQVELLLSVCTGALILGKAGLLDGITATTHASAFDELQKIAPKTEVIKTKRYVDSGKIITSGGISAGIDMSLYVVHKLLGDEALAAALTEMEYEWRQSD